MIKIEQLEIFEYPFDKLKEGYFTDKYFWRAKEILLKEKKHPQVIMQVFTKKDGIFCGGPEAAFVIKNAIEKSGNIKVKSLKDGDPFSPWETVMTIEGDYSLFAHLETVYLGILAKRSSVATLVRKCKEKLGKKELLYFAARFDHFINQEGNGYAAFVGGADTASTDANGLLLNKKGIGTVPHALIAAYRGDTVAATLAFDRNMPTDIKRIALVDFDNDCVKTSLEVARALKERLWGVRLDNAENLIDVSVEKMGLKEKGVGPQLVKNVRNALDNEGFHHVKIVVSGGFNPEKIEKFIQLNIPFDAVGIGSYFFSQKIDFTADVVMVNGKPYAKVGRQYNPNNRLTDLEFE